MSIRRIPVFIFLLAAAGLILLAGCETKPTAPTFDNPFDVDSPAGGDPFNLLATYSSGKITLIWTHPADYGIITYEVLHSPTYFGEYFSIGSVEAPASGNALFTYEDVTPTSNHYFKVQGFDEAGGFTATSTIAPTSLTTPALVVVGDDGSRTTASRHIVLNITVSQGDSLRLSQRGVPDSELVIAAGDSMVPVAVPWDLGEVDSSDTTLTVAVVPQMSTSLGDTNKVILDVDFDPALTLPAGGTRIASLTPTVAIDTTGLVSMRFAHTLEDLAVADWVPAAPTAAPLTLEDTAAPQDIHAEFLGDFGFSVTALLQVSADVLLDPGFYLALPEDHITEQNTILGICDANATQMRFAESLDFLGVSWQAYSDTAEITLSEGAGRKVIYGQFRNDFAQSAIFTDYAIYLSQPLAIDIIAPAQGDTLTAGTALLVQGLTTAPSGTAPVDSVKFDGGEGWEEAIGTTSWRYFWTAPTVEAAAAVVLRARAWADGDSVTTQVGITVVPE